MFCSLRSDRTQVSYSEWTQKKNNLEKMSENKCLSLKAKAKLKEGGKTFHPMLVEQKQKAQHNSQVTC